MRITATETYIENNNDLLIDTSAVIPLNEIGEFTDLVAWRRDLHRVVSGWNIRKAKIVTYLKGIQLQDVPVKDSDVKNVGDLASINKAVIETALLQNDHNRTRTAEKLGISRRALLRRIEKYGISSHRDGTA